MIFLQLRSGNSGPAFQGANQNDTLLWDTTERKFFVGPSAGGGVTSWNLRTGPVVPVSGDYDSDEVDNASTVSGASVSDALEHLQSEIDAGPSLAVPFGTFCCTNGAASGEFLIPFGGQDVSAGVEDEAVILAPYDGLLDVAVGKLGGGVQGSNITCVIRVEHANVATGPTVIAGQTLTQTLVGVPVAFGDRVSVQLNGGTTIDPNFFFWVSLSILAVPAT